MQSPGSTGCSRSGRIRSIHCGTSFRSTCLQTSCCTQITQANHAGANLELMASNTYSQGAQVEHPKFGLGTVMSSSDERIVIKFDDHGEKKFVTTMVVASLKKSDRQPPAEKRASRARKPKATAATQA